MSYKRCKFQSVGICYDLEEVKIEDHAELRFFLENYHLFPNLS